MQATISEHLETLLDIASNSDACGNHGRATLLREIHDALQAERKRIAEAISAEAEDGTIPPDNLAECAEYLMISEHNPALEKIERLQAENAALIKVAERLRTLRYKQAPDEIDQIVHASDLAFLFQALRDYDELGKKGGAE